MSDRPNVESTLILSRKDGSIIKTAGFTGETRRKRALSAAPETTNNQNATSEDAAGAENDKLTPAEELAASVFQFMKAAGILGATLATMTNDYGRESGSYTAKASNDAAQSSATDDSTNGLAGRSDAQVQLLRLRIKQLEVIIYPDPQYICCVVQRVGKQPGMDGR